MIIEIVIAVLIGNLLGTITGITPGIHINLVSLIIFNFLPFFLRFADPFTISAVIVSMAITHTFLDSIPSIYLGAPDESNILIVLPGHKMLLRGEGHNAVLLTLAGSLSSLLIALALFPVFILILKAGYPLIKPFIGYILLFISVFLIGKEKNTKLWAFLTFLLSGIFGILVFNNPQISEPLLPMLSGLFGISTLLVSILQNIKIPEQKTTPLIIEKKAAYQTIGSSVLMGSFASFLPGLGTSQIAMLGSQLIKKSTEEGFLILVGGITSVNMLASFVTWYVIEKERNGAIAVVSQIMGELTFETLVLFCAIILLSTLMATWLAIKISKKFSALIQKVNYRKLCVAIVIFISILVFSLSGAMGFFVFCVGTSIGLLPTAKGVGKNHLMGCLLVPVMLYFFL